MNQLAAIEIAQRLEAMGVTVRSVELLDDAENLRRFGTHGNRDLRRRLKRSQRRRGRGVTK